MNVYARECGIVDINAISKTRSRVLISACSVIINGSALDMAIKDAHMMALNINSVTICGGGRRMDRKSIQIHGYSVGTNSNAISRRDR